MRRALVTAALAAALVLSASASAAVQIKGVDASGYPTVRATVVTSSALSKPPSLTENGRPVVGLKAENLGRQKYVVVAIDNSRSMVDGKLAAAVAAARGFVAAKPDADRLSVVVFGNAATQLTDFSTARIDADQALNNIDLAPKNGTALNDAVVVAARSLGSQELPGRVLILLTDGRDEGSKASLGQALAAAKKAGVVVYPIAIVGKDFLAAPLMQLARETGGTYYPAPSTDALKGVYASIAAELGRTWRLEYVTAERPGKRVRLTTDVPGDGSTSASLTLPGAPRVADLLPPSQILPAHVYTSSAGTLMLAAAVGLLVLIAGGVALAARKGAWLRNRIEPHVAESRTVRKRAQKSERFGAAAGLFKATENSLGNLRQWKILQRQIERADLPLRTVEFFYISIGASVLFGLFAAVVGQSSIAILCAFVAGLMTPYGVLWYRARKRLNAFENQLPDLLITLAASLKAGHSFRQGIQTVVDEGMAPASDEFKRVLTETRLGRPMDDALVEMAERVGSKNLDFVITCVTIQRQVGGSLAGLFDMVADAVRQRQQFARKIRSLTAMGRMSAYVLIGLPFFVAGALTLMNPEYMDPLYHTSQGHKLVLIGLGMMAVGSAILKKIVSFRG